jgi:hypothetical protein
VSWGSALLLALAACSASSGDARSPYAQDLAEAATSAKSDFVRQILEDGQVLGSEYDEAKQRHLECLVAAGVTARYTADESGRENLVVDGELTPVQTDAEFDCYEAWMGSIGEFYWAMKLNPENTDNHTLVAACLVRNGLVPTGFTGADWEEAVRQVSEIHEADSEGNDLVVQIPTMSASDLVLPGGRTMDDPDITSCQIDPWR